MLIINVMVKKGFLSIYVVPGKGGMYIISTVMSHYHSHMDPDLGEGKCTVWRIPCSFVSCTDKLGHAFIYGKTDSEQPRYSSIT